MNAMKPYAFTKGYEAAKAGKDVSANPFPPLGNHFYEWEDGFFTWILANDLAIAKFNKLCAQKK